MIRIIDCGSQLTQNIARRAREARVYSEIVPYHTSLEKVMEGDPDAIIVSGGPHSVYDPEAPQPPVGTFTLAVPVLGICYGQQSMAHQRGGTVEQSTRREYGRATIDANVDSVLFRGLPQQQQVWMSHGDSVVKVPEGFSITARSNGHIAAMENTIERKYAVQFHPEVTQTEYGKQILENFLRVAGATRDWDEHAFIPKEIARIKELVGDAHVVGGVSGGVDSTIAATLLYRALGEQFHPIMVDNGLLRKDEAAEVYIALKQAGVENLWLIDAERRFLDQLRDVTDPDEKRKRIGHTFIGVFQEVAGRIPGIEYLMQGTLYPDVIESVPVYGASSRIKRHHNVGGLPDAMKLKLIEPLRHLFKDEARVIGRELGLPATLVDRHPFPGPGLGVRIVGEVTRERVRKLQQADAIFIQELRQRGLYGKISQAGACLPGVRTVGVMGDAHSYDEQVQLRAVVTTDFMTAEPFEFEWRDLRAITSRIVNEVPGVNRVVYDTTEKPPATIELE